jgi:hypothetical protein
MTKQLGYEEWGGWWVQMVGGIQCRSAGGDDCWGTIWLVQEGTSAALGAGSRRKATGHVL